MKAKLDDEKFYAIKQFARTHLNNQTAKEFGMSIATINNCKRFNTLEEYREYIKECKRKNYVARKYKIMQGNGIHFEPPKKPIDGTGGQTVNGDPFGDAIKLSPSIPISAQIAPEKDGPISIKRVDQEQKILPMTHEQYRKAYREQEIEIGTLNGKLAKAEMDLKRKTEDHDALKTRYNILLAAYRRKSEALEGVIQPLKPIDKVVSMPKNTSVPTKIEITVGDATIRVITEGNNV